MPEASLKIFNEMNNSVQFSTDNKVLTLASKGRFTFSSGYESMNFNNTTMYASLGINMSPFGIVAIRPVAQNLEVGLRFMQRSNNNVTLRLAIKSTDQSQQIDYWVYDIPSASSVGSGQLKFEIYAPDGSTQWQLYAKPLRAPTILQSVINSRGSTNEQSVAQPAGKTYALALGQPAGYVYYAEVGTPDGQQQRYSQRIFTDFVRWDANIGIAVRQLLLNGAAAYITSNVPADVFFSPRNAIVVDVTNH